MYKKSLLSLIVLLSFGNAFAQFGFEYDPTIPVKKGIQYLNTPWAGGLNYIQISDFDYDFDGDLDLFLFDRSSNNIRVLTQEDNMGTPYYALAYNAHNSFPADVRYRAALVDYDNDGRKDLFTYGIGGIKVYRNTGDIANGLQWELVSDLLYSQYVGTYTNLYVSSSDIPAIIDVDFDGDIDVLTFHQGGQHVEYHQNQSMEIYGIPDSLIFELKNECWGKFSEDQNTNSVILNDPNAPCVGGNIPNPLRKGEPEEPVLFKHSGSTLLALDIDNSGVLDLLIGDVSFTNLVLVINGGSSPNTDSPMIFAEPSFPANTTAVDMQLFPAGFFVDVDFDNSKDLIVGANARNISHNETSVLFYKNIETTEQPNFIYVENDHFQNDMIDHGTGSIPVFFDYDEDGLEDLFIANFYRYIPISDKESTIAYYKNTGTANAPEFSYIDYNFLNLDQETYGLRTVPTFGDLDNDGDKDLILGLEDGTLVYHENQSTGSGAVFGPPMINYQDHLGVIIDVGQYAFPQLFDLDGDNLLDLVIGKKDGQVSYYQNVGTPTSPAFELINSALGSVDVSTTTPDGYAAPHFFKENNEIKLFMGSIDGKLIYYDSIENNMTVGDTFSLVSNNYVGIDVDAYSAFAVNDINNDGNYNLFVGQDLGGIYHFEANPNSSIGINTIDKEHLLAVYPNPFADQFTVSSEEIIRNITVTDMNGKVVYESKLLDKKCFIRLSDAEKGLYFVTVELDSNEKAFRKIIKN